MGLRPRRFNRPVKWREMRMNLAAVWQRVSPYFYPGVRLEIRGLFSPADMHRDGHPAPAKHPPESQRLIETIRLKRKAARHGLLHARHRTTPIQQRFADFTDARRRRRQPAEQLLPAPETQASQSQTREGKHNRGF